MIQFYLVLGCLFWTFNLTAHPFNNNIGTNENVLDMDISPDGKNLLYSCDDGTFKVWDLVNGQLRYEITEKEEPIFDSQFNHSGSRFLTVHEKKLSLWDTNTGKKIFPSFKMQTPDEYKDKLLSVRLMEDETVIAGFNNQLIQQWDLKTGSLVASSTTQYGIINGTDTVRNDSRLQSAAFNEFNQYYAILNEKNEIWLWKWEHERLNLQVYWSLVSDFIIDEDIKIKISDDGRYLGIASEDSRVLVYDLSNISRTIKTSLDSTLVSFFLEGHTDEISALTFLPNSNVLASGSKDNSIWVWDLKEKKQLNVFSLSYNRSVDKIPAIAMSRDGKYLFGGMDFDDQVQVFSLEENKLLLTLHVINKENYYGMTPDFAYDGSKIGIQYVINEFRKESRLSYQIGLIRRLVSVDVAPNIRLGPDSISFSDIQGNLFAGDKFTFMIPISNESVNVAYNMKFGFEFPDGLSLVTKNQLLIQPLKVKDTVEHAFSLEISPNYNKHKLTFNLFVNHETDTIATKKVELSVLTKGQDTINSLDRQGKDFALFFAIKNYDNWGDLRNPISDCELLASNMKDLYGFETEIVENPSRAEILDKLKEYKEKVFPIDAQLFVFFSGHGDYDPKKNRGYLIPRDAEWKDLKYRSYLGHREIARALKKIDCRHILVGLDACYSGTFSEGRNISRGKGRPGESDATKRKFFVTETLKPLSRLYITSGGAERTPDGVYNSPLTERLIKSLKYLGGENKVLTIKEIEGFLEDLKPRPRVGQFADSEMDGNFLFILKEN